jgi:hypothetical protein
MYVAVQGNASDSWAGGLQVHGFSNGVEVALSSPFAPITTTPAWFDLSSLPPVDRIVIYALGAPPPEPVGVYGLDDLTFTYVPEPAGISLGLLALGGLLLRRRGGGARRCGRLFVECRAWAKAGLRRLATA